VDPILVEEIARRLDEPEALEALFRRDPEPFRAALGAVASAHPDSLVVRVWKARLDAEVVPPSARKSDAAVDVALVVVLSVIATIAARWPYLMVLQSARAYYAACGGRLVTVPLAVYLLVTAGRPLRLWGVSLAGLLLVGIQSYLLGTGRLPVRNSDVQALALMHLGVVEWLLLLVPFAGDGWRSTGERVAFLRYSGEVLVVSVVLLFGGILLTGLTYGLFSLHGIDIFDWYRSHVVVWGLLAAPLVATYLERAGGTRMASRIALPFVPLLLVTLVAYPVAVAGWGKSLTQHRELLIILNATLVAVSAVVVFVVCDRRRREASTLADVLGVALLVVSLAIDAVALVVVVWRFVRIGLWTSHVVVVGTNVVLLVFLGGTLREYLRFVRTDAGIDRVEAWIARYLVVFLAWAVIVGFAVPHYPAAAGSPGVR